MRVSVIIPTHNEAQAIARVLADLPSDLITEVIVVDSNSNDGTPEIAAKMGARVIQESRLRIWTGVPYGAGHGKFSRHSRVPRWRLQ
jgi:glycosyltransferase involved in cell wall biosynthesis